MRKTCTRCLRWKAVSEVPPWRKMAVFWHFFHAKRKEMPHKHTSYHHHNRPCHSRSGAENQPEWKQHPVCPVWTRGQQRVWGEKPSELLAMRPVWRGCSPYGQGKGKEGQPDPDHRWSGPGWVYPQGWNSRLGGQGNDLELVLCAHKPSKGKKHRRRGWSSSCWRLWREWTAI